METTDLKDLSVEQLEAMLARKKEEETKRLKKERESYEKETNELVCAEVAEAERISNIMHEFFKGITGKLEKHREKISAYGKIRSNSKGGYHLKSDDGKNKVVYRYSTICDWDERADKAEELLKDFLRDVVKKRDLELFELIMSLLEKNKEGKLEYSRIQALYAKENTFSDPRWKEAIRLFKESFRPVNSKMRIEFYKRNEQSNKLDSINLNFSGF